MELSSTNYDFAGWATRSNHLCTDGRTIMPNAFKHHDGEVVPLIWNHQHNDPFAVLGKALLHCVDGDVYAYCSFNNNESGNTAKELVQHGDVCSLSICANQLKHNASRGVTHGVIREVSLVVAGANPEARIDTVRLLHSDDGNEYDEEIHIYTENTIEIYHSDEPTVDTVEEEIEEENNVNEVINHADETNKEKTVQDVVDSMSEEQKTVMYALIGQALEDAGVNGDDEEEEKEVKHNVFDQEALQQDNVLTHADQMQIITMAKQSNVGSLKQAIKLFAEQNDMLSHADESDGYGVFEDYGVLFPELELLKKGEPETLYKYDQSWVSAALAKIHKSPFSRIRTRHADARLAELRAKGYQKKGNEKTIMGQIKMISRETTPQTIYIKDNLHRDDIIDITDFSIVDYQWKQMRTVMNETMVLAAMVGDGRELGDPDKISEEHIRPIWKDDEEYTIHVDVDVEAAKAELQGSETGAHFGENYVYAEAVITAALYSREKFKGTGAPDFYCTPHLVNVMLLARDLNGRRIYDSKADLAKALNCNSIVEVEQFEGLVRDTAGGDKKKLLGLFVNLNDYTFGSTKGGEITKFEDFDMDFNLQKFMLEARLSGSLYKLKSAIALEEPVESVAG